MAWLPAIGAFAIAAALIFLLNTRGEKANGSESVRAPLGIHVEGRLRELTITWKRNSTFVQSSTGGLLQIDDGPSHRLIKLDSALLATGSIVYGANSDDVSFQLEVYGPQGQVVREGIRILDGEATAWPAKTRNDDGGETTVPVALAARTAAAAHAVPGHVSVNPLAANAPATDTAATQPVKTAGQTQLQGELPVPSAMAPAPGTNAPIAQSIPPSANTAPTNLPIADVSPDASRRPEDVAQAAQPSAGRPGSDAPVGQSSVTQAPVNQAAVNQAKVEGSSLAAIVVGKPIKEVMPQLNGLGVGNAYMQFGQIEVDVEVSDTGRVTEAHLAGKRKAIPAYIAYAVVNAAKQWVFEPSTLRGRKVASNHSIVFRFVS